MSKSNSKNQGVALIIVLAFVVLLTGLSLAYFSHTATDRQLARASFHDTSAELLAHSALGVCAMTASLHLVFQAWHPLSAQGQLTRQILGGVK